MTTLNTNQISALESLNKQIISNQIPNAEPHPICTPQSADSNVVDTNTPTTPKQSHSGLRIHKTDINGVMDMDELHNIIIAHVQKIDFLQYIDDMGGSRNKYIRDDKTKIPYLVNI